MSDKKLTPRNEHDLVELARRRFGTLSQSEIKLIAAAVKGHAAVCGPNDRDDDPANDPETSANWPPAREIRGALIRWLFVDPLAKQALDQRGLRIYGAKIVNGLDLSFVKADFPLGLQRCAIDSHVNLDYLEVPSFAFSGSSVNSLSADFARVKGTVRFDSGFHSKTNVQIRGAYIAGNLDCQGGRFETDKDAVNPTLQVALNAESARVDGSVRLRDNFSAEGAVRLYRIQIGGNLDCERGKIVGREIAGLTMALNAESAKIGGSVLLRGEFSADGEVRLMGAEVGAYLACDGAKLKNPPKQGTPQNGTALQAEGIVVSSSVLLWKGFSAVGSVQFFGARIKGSFVCFQTTLTNPVQANLEQSGLALTVETAEIGGYLHLRDGFSAQGTVRLFRSKIALGLDCSTGKFENPGGVALDAYGAQIGGHVLLRNGFESKGMVQLAGAELQGDLECRNAKMLNAAQNNVKQSGVALHADGIKVGGSILLSHTFLAEGVVRLFGAQIGHNLECENAEFRNPFQAAVYGTGTALLAESCKVTGTVLLRNKFRADGIVRFFGARIEGDMDCNDAIFNNEVAGEDPGSSVTFDAAGLSVGGRLILSNSTHNGAIKLTLARIARGLLYDEAIFYSLDLRDAVVGWIVDDAASWPQAGRLYLDGFVYNRISDGPSDAANRLEWLSRVNSFKRQTYRQLASVFDAAGDDVGARKVQSEMQRRIWADRHWITRPVSWLLQFTIGYGYFPLRAIGLLLLLVVIGSITYSVGYHAGAIVPSNKESYAYFEEHCSPPSYYDHFHPVAYSLENSFPVIKLGAQEKWVPAPKGPLIRCDSHEGLMERFTSIKSSVTPNMLRWLRWVQICCGWILTTLFVAGVTGLLRKN